MKHYVLGSNKGSIASPKPAAASGVPWTMGFAALACAAAAFITYLGFQEPASDAQPQAQAQAHTTLDKAALLGSAASKAAPSVWGGKGCSGGALNPFANRVECDPSAQAQALAEQAANAQEVATQRRAMIRNAIGGDVAQFESYWQYSKNCRKQPDAASDEDSGCDPAALKATDALFVMTAENLAARGNTQAQLALEQIASISVSAQP